jgi:hypothetical protein
MRIVLTLFILLAAGLGAGVAQTPAPDADLLARLHYMGAASLKDNPNAAKLKELCSLPAAQHYLDQSLQTLARLPFKLLRERVGPAANDEAGLIRPLLDDCLQSESYAELRQRTNGTPEIAFAIRLGEDRAQLWNKNLATVLQTWTGQPVTQPKPGVWELGKHHAPNLIRGARAGDWLVLGAGDDRLPLFDEMVARINRNQPPASAPAGDWLNGWLDGPKLAATFPSLPRQDWPQTSLSVTGKGEYLHTKAVLDFPQKLNWTPQPWRIPTNLIHEPLTSFTAMQGFAPWLERHTQPGQFQPEATPDQLFVWALRGIPLQTFAASPAGNPKALLAKISPDLLAWGKAHIPPTSGSIAAATNGSALEWKGLPFIAPYLSAEPGKDTGSLFAGIFPNTLKSPPLPADLLNQVAGHQDLVYYDWELTQERLLNWRNLDQLRRIITGTGLPATNAPGELLITAIAPKLGNTATIITVTGSNELTCLRKSHCGFTGFELVALNDWLTSTNFPRFDFTWPPLTQRRPMPMPVPAPKSP